MPIGAITGYIDVAQLVLYAFWLFFAALIIYLRREDKREGYPLESDRSARVKVQGFPAMPAPKTFTLADGKTVEAPRAERARAPLNARPTAAWPGAPLEPLGDPMLDGVGPAAYNPRTDEPDLTVDGEPKIVPLRVARDFSIASRDPDPRGMTAVGADGEAGGTVTDAWVDRSEPIVRYLEVSVPTETEPRRVLVPMTLAKIDRRAGVVRVQSVMGRHFATAPGTRNPDQVTQGEEDRISAYFASGNLYATSARQEPLL